MNESDKITAELMALVHKVKRHAMLHNEFDNSVALNKALSDTKQAIRRAVDWEIAAELRSDEDGRLSCLWRLKQLAPGESLDLYARSTKP